MIFGARYQKMAELFDNLVDDFPFRVVASGFHVQFPFLSALFARTEVPTFAGGTTHLGCHMYLGRQPEVPHTRK